MNKAVVTAAACVAAFPACAWSEAVTDPLVGWLSAGVKPDVRYTAPVVSDASAMLRALAREESAAERSRERPGAEFGEAGRIALYRRGTDGTVVGAGAGSTSASFFGLASSGLAPYMTGGNGKFNAPYFAMVHDARHAGVSFSTGEGGRLRLGVLSEGRRPVEVLPTWTGYAKRALLSAEYERRAGRAVAIFSAGVLRESGGFLGNLQGSSLAPMGSARTSFAALSLGYALTPRLSLVGMASTGRTSGFNEQGAGETERPSVSTMAYSVGLSGRQLWNSSDRFGLTLTVPTKVTQGSTSLSGVVLQRDDDALSYTARTLNLAPTATERDIEMTYSYKVSSKARVAGALMLRLNPGHDASTARDLLLGIRYGRRF